MKKVILLLITCMVIHACPLSATDIESDDHISPQALPVAAKVLLLNHFKAIEIVAVIQDRENKTYEVRSKDGKKLDFKSNGEWTLIDCNEDEIPYLLVPKKIRSIIAKKYGPYVHAIEIKRTKKTIKVELNNHVEMKFKI